MTTRREESLNEHLVFKLLLTFPVGIEYASTAVKHGHQWSSGWQGDRLMTSDRFLKLPAR